MNRKEFKTFIFVVVCIVCTCSAAHMGDIVCTFMCRSEVNLEYVPQAPSTFFSKTVSLDFTVKLGVYHIGQAGWPRSLIDSPVPTS